MEDCLKGFLDGLSRYAEHLPGNKTVPLEILVLRGHMLIEEELREIIHAKFVQRDIYDLQESKYAVLVRLAQALYGDVIPDWKWQVAQEINGIRNLIAHHLKNPKVELKLDRLFHTYRINDNDFAYVKDGQIEKLAYCMSDIHSTFLRINQSGQ